MNGRGGVGRGFISNSRGWLCGLITRARSRVTLRKILAQFSELDFFVALECQICAALAKVQPAQPSIRASSAFPNTGVA